MQAVTKDQLKEKIKLALRRQYGKTIEEAKKYEIYYAVSKAVMDDVVEKWYNTKKLTQNLNQNKCTTFQLSF